MNHKDQALWIASKAFRVLANDRQRGKLLTFSEKELRNFGNLCALALPMKYRFSREELEAMHT